MRLIPGVALLVLADAAAVATLIGASPVAAAGLLPSGPGACVEPASDYPPAPPNCLEPNPDIGVLPQLPDPDTATNPPMILPATR
jgi:hypothetical protein